MPCYILRAGETEMVKIGWADSDVEARRKELQTAHWEDLTAIRIIDGAAWIERAMHRQFAGHRVRREWFRFHPDMMIAVPVQIDETERRPRLPYDETDKPLLTVPGVRLLAKYIEAESLTLEGFAERVGVSDVTVHRWVKGKARPSYDKACEIARATDGKVGVAAFYPPASSNTETQAAQ